MIQELDAHPLEVLLRKEYLKELKVRANSKNNIK